MPSPHTSTPISLPEALSGEAVAHYENQTIATGRISYGEPKRGILTFLYQFYLLLFFLVSGLFYQHPSGDVCHNGKMQASRFCINRNFTAMYCRKFPKTRFALRRKLLKLLFFIYISS